MAEFPASPLFTNELSNSLINDQWLSPKTYRNNYCNLPQKSGVYLFHFIDLYQEIPEKVIYVGKSINLKNRLEGHEILSKAKKQISNYQFIKIWFKLLHEDLITHEELRLIKYYNPSFNILHKERRIF